MTLQLLIAVLRARWKTIGAVLLACLALAGMVTLLVPKKYSATATVVIDMKSPDPINGAIVQGNMSPAFLATQVDVLVSERVATRVVRALDLEKKAELVAQWQKADEPGVTFESWAGPVLGLGLDVKPSRESNVISVTYKARDRHFAAQAANAYVQAYLDTVMELRTEPAKQYNAFFDTHAKTLREKLEAAQHRLSVYQQKNGLLGTDERVDVETTRLTDLTARLVAAQTDAADARSRSAQSAANADRNDETLKNVLVSALRADVVKAGAELREARERLGENHPRIVDLRARVDELEKRLREETSRVVSSVQVTSKVNATKYSELQAETEAQRAKILKLKATRDDALVLQRDVESAQKAYEGVLTRLSQSSMESQSTPTNVSILGRASPPRNPSSPNTRLNFALAAFLGTLLGIVAAIVRELMDSRVRADDDVSRLINQSIMVSIPDCGKGQLTRRLPAARRATLALGMAK